MDTRINKTCPKCGHTVGPEFVRHTCGQGFICDETEYALEIKDWIKKHPGKYAVDYLREQERVAR